MKKLFYIVLSCNWPTLQHFDGDKMTGHPKTVFPVILLLVIFSGFLKPIFAQQSSPNQAPPAKQSLAKAPTLLIDTDDACRLLIDGVDKGVITSDHSQSFKVTLGEHILKCTVEAVPDLVWRKVIEVKSTSQVAAVVALKGLHLQYDAALAKAKSQKDEEEGAAAKKLAEAEATRRAEEKVKTEFPRQMFNQLNGTWTADTPWEGPKGNPDVPENNTVSYELTFKQLDESQGQIVFSLEWQHLIFDAYNPFRVKGTAFGHRYEASFSPTPTGRFQAVSHSCEKAAWEGKKFVGQINWTPCPSVDEEFGPGRITILSQDQLLLETGGLRLTFTRK